MKPPSNSRGLPCVLATHDEHQQRGIEGERSQSGPIDEATLQRLSARVERILAIQAQCGREQRQRPALEAQAAASSSRERAERPALEG